MHVQDLAAFVGVPKTVIETLPAFDRKYEVGSVTVCATKGMKTYDFVINSVKGCRTDTPCSGPTSFMYCLVRWNGEELCTTDLVYDHMNAIWTRRETEMEPIYVNCHPFLTIDECDLEIQLWQVINERPDANKYFLGSLFLESEQLKEFLAGDRFYRQSVHVKLRRSVQVAREHRANEISGHMTLVGGRTGFLAHPDNYLKSDVPFLISPAGEDTGNPDAGGVKLEGSVSTSKSPAKIGEGSLALESSTTSVLPVATEVKADGTVANNVERGKKEEDMTEEELILEIKKQQLMEADAEAARLEEEALQMEMERIKQEEKERAIRMATRTKYYEIKVLGVRDLSFAESSEKLVCTGFIGHVNLGLSAAVTPVKGDLNLVSATWERTDTQNSFVFPLRIPHPDDSLFLPDEEIDCIKINIFDLKPSGRFGRHLGCIRYAGRELYNIVNENGFAKRHTAEVKKDELITSSVNGKVDFSIGPKGAKCEVYMYFNVCIVLNVECMYVCIVLYVCCNRIIFMHFFFYLAKKYVIRMSVLLLSKP